VVAERHHQEDHESAIHKHPIIPAKVDLAELEVAVKAMYARVATEPRAEFHFETGRALAEKLGYAPARLDRVPAPAIESFAGVGHHFELAELRAGEHVLDLGSGSGTDAFVAATYVGPTGRVTGVDMTDAQREKAITLRDATGGVFDQVVFLAGYIEHLPVADDSVDCVISNGVINLVADKDQVFREAARVLRPGGRLAISDIVTAVVLPESVVCDATLWAACIGGAMHREDYQRAIEDAGFAIEVVQLNREYQFLPGRAQRSATRYQVQSISLRAVKR
jgi:ubiquinone/menaquinone biosynthesis C-methylase UbiE